MELLTRMVKNSRKNWKNVTILLEVLLFFAFLLLIVLNHFYKFVY